MLKFFGKCMLGGLPVLIIIVFCFLFPEYYMDDEYPLWQQIKDYESLPSSEDYSVIVLGDSRSKVAFNPEVISDEMYNLSLGGASPIENYYGLKRYLENHQSPDVAFVAFAPNHYFENNEFWTRSMYFHYFTFEQEKEIFQTAKQYPEAGFIREEGDWTDWAEYRLRLPNKYTTALLNCGFVGRGDYNSSKYNESCEERGHTYYGDEECWEEGYPIPIGEMSPFMQHYLYGMIDMLLDEGTTVVVEQLPLNIASFGGMSDDQIDQYLAMYEQIQQDYPQITVRVSPHIYEDDCFGDRYLHTNVKGAERYSQYIKEEYKELL